MAFETNKLIKEFRFVADDGCDHTGSIIDRMHSAARARCRVFATPPVKPVPVSAAAKASGAVVKIGNRPSYGKTILTGIYQLHLSGKSDRDIARSLRMSEEKVRHLLSRKTATRKTIFMQCAGAPLPLESEILRRLAAESKA